MNNKKSVHSGYLILTFAFILTFINACNEYNEPPTIYNPGSSTAGVPKITSITPSGGAIAGVREITINGENFTTGDTTWIFVGSNQRPRIKSMSNTKIELYRPPNSGSSLDIKVVVPSGEGVARVGEYNLEAPIDSINTFLVGSGLPDYFALEIDKDGTYWTVSPRRIDKTTSDGLFFTIYKDRDQGFTTVFNTPTDMKFGHKGYLYLLINRADIYRVDAVDSTKRPVIYATISGGTAVKLDFDDNGNMYASGNGGVYLVRPDATDSTGTVVPTSHYTDKTLVDVRVSNKQLYVADAKNIWKNSINADGSLGADETIVNLNNIAGLESCSITSINIDGDGKVLLSLTGHASYSLFILESDGSVTPYYVDNILPINIKQLVWGYNSRNLFLSRSKLINSGMRLYRVGMEKKGAVNYGREF